MASSLEHPAVWFAVAVALAVGGGLLAQEPRHALDAALVLGAIGAVAWRPYFGLLVVLLVGFKNSPLIQLLTVVAGGAVLVARGRDMPGWAVRVPFALLVAFAVWRLPIDPSLDEEITTLTLPVLGSEYLRPVSEELIAWWRLASLLVVFSMAAWLVRDAARLRGLVATLLAGAAWPVVTGLKEVVTGDYAGRAAGFDAIDGPFSFPNYFAFYLVGVILLALVTLLETRTLRWRAPLAVLLAGSATCLFFTYTRSAWLGVAIGFVVIAALRERKLFALGAAALALVAFAAPSSVQRVEDRFADLGADTSGVDANSWSWRTGQWDRMAHYGYEQPLSGGGFGSYPRLTVEEFGTRDTQYTTVVTTRTGERLAHGFTAHNDFVRTFVELGVPGLLLWTSTLVALLLTALRSRRVPDVAPWAVAATGVVVAVLFMSAADNLMGYTAALMLPMALVGGVAGVALTARRRAAPPRSA